MNTIEITRAGIKDLDTLMKWRRRVVAEVFGLKDIAGCDRLMRANRDYYRNALRDNSHVGIFARYGGEVVGCGGVCLQQEMPSPDNPTGRCGYLMNIYVTPEFRGHRCGHTIVEWLVRFLEKEGITKIYLETTQGARALYSDEGFAPMHDMMIYTAI